MTCGLALTCLGQNVQTRQEPELLPLTDDEKKVNFRDLVAKQPDFTAVENYSSAREISGFSSSSKVARKGTKFRVDTGMVVVFTELNKPTIRLAANKRYEEGVGVYKPFVSATTPLNPTNLLGFEDIDFVALGAIELDGARLLKIQAKSKAFNQEVFLYADRNQKNLIRIVQILGPTRRSIQRYDQVSFNVPAELFDLSGFTALPKFSWKKVVAAQVTHQGKKVGDGLVYRHADYLYVHAGEFSHFLIDLKKGGAMTVVYRGMLLSKDGYYIWSTTEDEAVSIGEPADSIDSKDEDYVKVTVTGNSVTVPDPDKKGRILLKVEW